MENLDLKKGLSNEKMKKVLKNTDFIIKFKEKRLKEDLLEKIQHYSQKDFNGFVLLEMNLDYFAENKKNFEKIKALKIKQLCLKLDALEIIKPAQNFLANIEEILQSFGIHNLWVKIKSEDQIDFIDFMGKMSILQKRIKFTLVLELQRKEGIDQIKDFKQIKIDLSTIFYLLACEGHPLDNLFIVLNLHEFGYQNNSEKFFNELISTLIKCIPIFIGGIVLKFKHFSQVQNSFLKNSIQFKNNGLLKYLFLVLCLAYKEEKEGDFEDKLRKFKKMMEGENIEEQPKHLNICLGTID